MSKLLVIFILGASGLMGQGPVAFEVASIKVHITANPGNESSNTDVSPGGRLTGRNVTVRKLIRNAFLVEDFRIEGAPGWIDTVSYDIDARTSGGMEITRDNISQLIKSLLFSRFQFSSHMEQREVTEYALEAGKNGPKVTPHVGDTKPSMSTNSNSGAVSLKASKISMSDFAGTLARQVGRPVVDRTGLTGDYDFDLKWSTDQAAAGAGPSIFTAVQELGLRLVSIKGPTDVLVIDRVEKASEN